MRGRGAGAISAQMADKARLSQGSILTGGAPEGFDAKLVADLVAKADGPVIHVETRPGRPFAAGEALSLPLVPGPLVLPEGGATLRGE